MNVIVVGSGAREHALCRILHKSYLCEKVFCFPGNYGISQIAECKDISTKEDIVEECIKINPDLVVVGPENYLSENLAGELRNKGLNVFGPDSEGAKLESSKEFMKKFCQSHNIPTAKSQTFVDFDEAKNYLESFNGPIVVKYDGLHGGKGVKVQDIDFDNIDDLEGEFKDSKEPILCEEKLVGEEFSLMSFVDGKVCKHMPVVQDHKRAYEGDTGPNTGGMGTYSFGNHSLPFLSEKDINEAQKTNELVAKQLFEKTGTPYVGILYGGFMLTRDGVKVIEYNARFGDPEAMNVLSILESDFLSICISMIDGNLKSQDVSFERLATVCKYVVPVGYPDKPEKNFEVFCDQNDRSLFLASVMLKDQKLIACGSRTAAVVGKNKDVFQAELFAEAGIANISGNLFHRKDIGTKKLIDSRIKRMKELLQ